MAQIVLGLGTSHGPQLLMPPELWELRAQADRQNKQHWFRGKSYDFPTLAALRQPDGFAAQITPPAMRAHYDRCQQAMGTVADIYATAALDIAVIIGNDQGEIFTDENIPAFSVFFGARASGIFLTHRRPSRNYRRGSPLPKPAIVRRRARNIPVMPNLAGI